jgi:hypothetical protein
MAVMWLLLIGAAPAIPADEAWELYEETITGKAPLRMTLIGRFPSSEACNARAMELSATPAPAGVTRLGYMCIPAAPPPPRRP